MRNILAALIVLYTPAALSVPVTWTLQNGLASNGDIEVTGSFVFDADAPPYTHSDEPRTHTNLAYTSVAISFEDIQQFSTQDVEHHCEQEFQYAEDSDGDVFWYHEGCVWPDENALVFSENGDRNYPTIFFFESPLTNSGGVVEFSGHIESVLCNGWCSNFSGQVVASVVPIPAAVWLLASGLGLLGWLRRR